MKKRLHKVLSEHGVASRRAAEELIAAGRVLVGGRPAAVGQSVDEDKARITVDGKPLRRRPPIVCLMLNKPRGIVASLSDELGRRDLRALLSDVNQRVVPIGRLDRDSEGLLLLTNDGALVQRLTHPSHAVEKIYRVSVRLNGGTWEAAAAKMRESIRIDGKPTLPARVVLLRTRETEPGPAADTGPTAGASPAADTGPVPKSAPGKAFSLPSHGGQNPRSPDKIPSGVLEVALREGKKRQIRLLCEHAGLTVARLSRRAVGELSLGSLAPGEYRFLTESEIQYLRSL